MRLNNRILKTILFCIFISYTLYCTKPNIIFDDNNEFKKFGLTKKETIYPFWLVITVFSFIFYSCCLLSSENYI